MADCVVLQYVEPPAFYPGAQAVILVSRSTATQKLLMITRAPSETLFLTGEVLHHDNSWCPRMGPGGFPHPQKCTLPSNSRNLSTWSTCLTRRNTYIESESLITPDDRPRESLGTKGGPLNRFAQTNVIPPRALASIMAPPWPTK